MPERNPRGLHGRSRRRSTFDHSRASPARCNRCADSRLHGDALRRFRSLRSAVQNADVGPLARSVRAPRAWSRGVRRPRAATPEDDHAAAHRPAAATRKTSAGQPTMITFWIIAAVMLIAAVLCAVVPLMQRESAASAPRARALSVSLYRRELADADADLRTGALSPGQYASVRSDIEQRVLADTAGSTSLARRSTPRTATRAATCAVLIALLPSAACLLYLKLGEPAALKLNNPLDDSLGVSHDMSSMSVEMMVSRLAFRLRDHAPDPRDAAAWATLARSYTVLDRPTDAVAAYAKAVALDPGDAPLRADFADAIASADDGRLAGRASAALDTRAYARAIGYWRRLIATLKVDSPEALQMQKNINAAEGLSAVTVDIRLADGAQ